MISIVRHIGMIFINLLNNRFGQEKKFKNLLGNQVEVPGPGKYEKPGRMGKEGPRFTVGKEERGDKQRAQTPGPGSYEVHLKNKIKAPVYTISEIRPSTALPSKNVPGPGSYDSTFKNRPRTPAYK